ncbi:MAG: MJ0042-type zinc finger domain-containing protein [Pseudolabrys sp.]
MLIACPSCSTSYMSEPASLGPAGRTVRCARCKTTWFADASNTMPEIAAAADGAINESEVQGSPGVLLPDRGSSRTGSDAEPAQESAEAAQAMVAAAHSAPAFAPEEPPVPEAVAVADAPSVVPTIDPRLPMPPLDRSPMKLRTLQLAANGCRRGASRPAARPGGQRSFLCCSLSTSR